MPNNRQLALAVIMLCGIQLSAPRINSASVNSLYYPLSHDEMQRLTEAAKAQNRPSFASSHEISAEHIEACAESIKRNFKRTEPEIADDSSGRLSFDCPLANLDTPGRTNVTGAPYVCFVVNVQLDVDDEPGDVPRHYRLRLLKFDGSPAGPEQKRSFGWGVGASLLILEDDGVYTPRQSFHDRNHMREFDALTMQRPILGSRGMQDLLFVGISQLCSASAIIEYRSSLPTAGWHSLHSRAGIEAGWRELQPVDADGFRRFGGGVEDSPVCFTVFHETVVTEQVMAAGPFMIFNMTSAWIGGEKQAAGKEIRQKWRTVMDEGRLQLYVNESQAALIHQFGAGIQLPWSELPSNFYYASVREFDQSGDFKAMHWYSEFIVTRSPQDEFVREIGVATPRREFPQREPEICLGFMSCDRLGLLERNMRSIVRHMEAAERGLRYEIVWLDNGSSQRHKVRALEEQFQIEKVMLLHENMGMPFGINQMVGLCASKMGVHAPYIMNLEEDFEMRRDLTVSRTAVLRMTIEVLEHDERILMVSLRQEANNVVVLGPWEFTPSGIAYRLMCGYRTDEGGAFGGFSNAAGVWHTQRLLSLGRRNESLYDDEPQMMVRTSYAGMCSAQMRLDAGCGSSGCNYAFVHTGMLAGSPCKMIDGHYMKWGSKWNKEQDDDQFKGDRNHKFNGPSIPVRRD